MKEIILIAGGGHCRSVIDVVEQENKFKIAGIVDKPELLSNKILNYEVIGNDNDLPKLASKYKYALITAGQIKSPSLRIKLYEIAKDAGFVLPSIVSPRAYIAKSSNLGEGTIIMHDALINSNVEIGKNCIINTRALIEHDSSVGDHCHISTNVIINGGVKVYQGSFIGSGSIIVDGKDIQHNSFIKARSIVK